MMRGALPVTGTGGALLQTMVEVLMRVLLHGGPYRCLLLSRPRVALL